MKKKIIVVCGNGLGTSLIIEGLVKEASQSLDLDAEISHEDLSSASSSESDIWVGMNDIADQLRAMGKKNVIGLKNIMDKEGLKNGLASLT